MKHITTFLLLTLFCCKLNSQDIKFASIGCDMGYGIIYGESAFAVGADLFGIYVGVTSNHSSVDGEYLDYSDRNSEFSGQYDISRLEFGSTMFINEKYMVRPKIMQTTKSEIWQNHTGITTKFLNEDNEKKKVSLGLDLGYVFKEYFYVNLGVDSQVNFNIKVGFNLSYFNFKNLY